VKSRYQNLPFKFNLQRYTADATPFTFESADATQKGAGMTPFTISGKRKVGGILTVCPERTPCTTRIQFTHSA
jgi:hypothetical protein